MTVGTQHYNGHPERQRAAVAADTDEAQWQHALNAAGIGAWELDLQTRATWRSLRYDQIFGYRTPPPQFTFQMFLDHVLPEDRDRVHRAFQDAVITHGDWDFECRIRRVDGAVRWIWGSGHQQDDAQGRPARMLGLVQDITERKQSEEALQRHARRFELLTNTAEQLLKSNDPQREVESLCRQVMELLDCHAFFNFLVDEEAGKLHLNACAGIPEEEARRIEWLDYGVAVCGCAARDGCRIVAEHIPTTPDIRTDLVKSYGITAYACHPLLGPGGAVLGTLSFGTRSRETFSDDDLSLMKAVTDQVATAMTRISGEQARERLLAEVQRNVSELNALREQDRLLLHTVAHDLRSPATLINGHLSLMLELLGPQQHLAGENVDALQRALRRMGIIIDDLTEVTRLDAGGISLELEPVALAAYLPELLANHAGDLDLAQIALDIPEDLPPVNADPARLERILANLLINARKYSAPGAPIRVDARLLDGQVEIRVTDQGQGIPADEIDRIFDRFYRCTYKRRGEGIGLGLYITRALVEAHAVPSSDGKTMVGGRIRVESEIGKGSTFAFTLPLAEA
ncbi:MAG: sensor histidine kinase [Armatimonadota bacterium]